MKFAGILSIFNPGPAGLGTPYGGAVAPWAPPQLRWPHPEAGLGQTWREFWAIPLAGQARQSLRPGWCSIAKVWGLLPAASPLKVCNVGCWLWVEPTPMRRCCRHREYHSSFAGPIRRFLATKSVSIGFRHFSWGFVAPGFGAKPIREKWQKEQKRDKNRQKVTLFGIFWPFCAKVVKGTNWVWESQPQFRPSPGWGSVVKIEIMVNLKFIFTAIIGSNPVKAF